jgi:sulfite reductase beta subunit-like hemoprotein
MNQHAQTAPVRRSIAGEHAFVLEEIREYEVSVHRFLEGKVPEPVFLESRLRHGIYGQRQDGVHMVRSKLPLGLISPEQLEAFADIAETWGNGVSHLTTRQDIQLHFVPLTDTPELMRVLDAAEMTSREACGNVVRNVCASPLAGVEPGEAFDVTSYGMAAARFLLRIPDGQSLGRKFKVTFSGTWDRRFNLGALHDVGLTAQLRDGQRGFHVVVGGGLGAVPHEAKVFAEFLPVEELLPTMRAIVKVFATHGEKQKRARARMKFLVADWGIDRFRDEVLAVRAGFAPDPVWTSLLADVDAYDDLPRHPPGGLLPAPRDADDARWLRTNVVAQRQDGYVAVNVRVPQGDLSPAQLRGLATLLRAEVGDTTRVGTDQSLWIRWVSTDRIFALRDGLRALGLGDAVAGGLGDTVTCPGADTCKLGITTPRSLARQMQAELDALARSPKLEKLRIHVSGCPNACAQHHIGDIGLFGAARTIDGVTAPHFMLLLGGLAGGRHEEVDGDGFGATVIKLPAFRVGEAVTRLARAYEAEAADDEPFGRWVRRNGRARYKALLEDLVEIPPPSVAPHLYVEHGKEGQAFKIVRGTGECAGAVVLQGDLLLMDADRLADAAVGLLDDDADPEVIRATALGAFDKAARALLSSQGVTDPADDDVLPGFRQHFYDVGRIYEGVGHYYLQARTEAAVDVTGDRLRRLVVEAGLFVEEVHGILAKILGTPGMGS